MKTIKSIILVFGGLYLFGCSPDSQTKTHVVEIKQMKFVPAGLTVAPGDSVKWINRDIVEHDVLDEENGLFKSKRLQTNDNFAVKITGKQEQIQYLCSLHPVMQGKITIKNP